MTVAPVDQFAPPWPTATASSKRLRQDGMAVANIGRTRRHERVGTCGNRPQPAVAVYNFAAELAARLAAPRGKS